MNVVAWPLLLALLLGKGARSGSIGDDGTIAALVRGAVRDAGILEIFALVRARYVALFEAGALGEARLVMADIRLEPSREEAPLLTRHRVVALDDGARLGSMLGTRFSVGRSGWHHRRPPRRLMLSVEPQTLPFDVAIQRRVLRGSLARFESCFVSHAAPSASTSVTVRLVLDDAGRRGRIEVVHVGPPNEALGRCLTDTLQLVAASYALPPQGFTARFTWAGGAQ